MPAPQPGGIPGYIDGSAPAAPTKPSVRWIALAARSAKDFAVEALITETEPVPETETLAKGLPSAAARGAVAYPPGGPGGTAPPRGEGAAARAGRGGPGGAPPPAPPRRRRGTSRRSRRPVRLPPEGRDVHCLAGRKVHPGARDATRGGIGGSRAPPPRLRPGCPTSRAGSLAPPACESLRSARAARQDLGRGGRTWNPRLSCQPSSDVARDFSRSAYFAKRRAIRLRRCFFRPAPQTSARAPGRRGARCPRPRPSLPSRDSPRSAGGTPPVPPAAPAPPPRRGPRRLVRLGKARVPAGAAEDAPLRLAAVTARALAHLRASRTWSRATGCSEATTQTPRPASLPRDRARRRRRGRDDGRCGDARWRRSSRARPASLLLGSDPGLLETATDTRKPGSRVRGVHARTRRRPAAYPRARGWAGGPTRSLRFWSSAAPGCSVARSRRDRERWTRRGEGGERAAACSVTYHATDDYSFREKERTKASREPNDDDDGRRRRRRKPFAPITASRYATRRCATDPLRMWC